MSADVKSATAQPDRRAEFFDSQKLAPQERGAGGAGLLQGHFMFHTAGSG